MTILDTLPATINSAFKSLFYDAVMTVDVPQDSPDPADPLPPVPTPYPCKAIVEAYSDYFRKSGLVGAKDRRVLILAKSVAVKPAPGMRVTIQNVTFTIQDVSTDPATAVWECRGTM
jgi:hypothetical protein